MLNNIPISKKLGLANLLVPKPKDFAQQIFKMASDIIIYQQQLVHSIEEKDGPTKAMAEYCSSIDNSSINDPRTLRQVSAVDTLFARRNLSDSPTYRLLGTNGHATQNSSNPQIYYLNNEPEIAHFYSTATTQCATCFDPVAPNPADPTGNTPPPVDSYFGSGNGSPWWVTDTGALPTLCSNTLTTRRRVKPEVLAYFYLKLKNEANLAAHCLLPPSTAEGDLGWSQGDYSYLGQQQNYWSVFYNTVFGSGQHSVNGYPSVNKIAKAQYSSIKAIHTHQYLYGRWQPSPNTRYYVNPITSLRDSIGKLKLGINWFRNNMTPNPALPLDLDVLISESGPAHWDFPNDDDQKFAGGFRTFRDGLANWNSWLHFVTQTGSGSTAYGGCNLNTGKTIYSCIHEASIEPYVTERASNSTANFTYVDVNNSWFWYSKPFNVLKPNGTVIRSAVDTNYGGPMYDVNNNAVTDPGIISTYAFRDCFTLDNGTAWQSSTYPNPVSAWRNFKLTPYGACYASYSIIGNYSGSDWLYTTYWAQPNLYFDISIPPGWSTAYIPVVKDMGGPSNISDAFYISISRTGYPYTVQGSSIYVGDYPDSLDTNYTSNGNTTSVKIYASMVYPLMCCNNTSQPVTIRVSFYRNFNGIGIWLGRPVVLPVICSWV